MVKMILNLDTDNMEEKLENLSLLMDKYLSENIDSKKL